MEVPPDAGECAYAELFLLLPPTWPLTMEAFKSEDNYWPLRLLKRLARFPLEHSTWLGYGHTVTNGDPNEPYAPGTKLCGALLMPPISLPKDFGTLKMPDVRTVRFWQVLPLYQEEMDLKVRQGTNALLDLFDRHGAPDVVSPKRRNVCRAAWKFWN